MKTFKVASFLLLSYAVIFVLDTFFSAFQAGGANWGRVLIFVPLAALFAWGLWQSQMWAWIGSLIFTVVFGLFGLLSLLSPRLSRSGMPLSSLWTSRDMLFMVAMDIILVAALMTLLHPDTRSALQNSRSKA